LCHQPHQVKRHDPEGAAGKFQFQRVGGKNLRLSFLIAKSLLAVHHVMIHGVWLIHVGYKLQGQCHPDAVDVLIAINALSLIKSVCAGRREMISPFDNSNRIIIATDWLRYVILLATFSLACLLFPII